jgi:hypothetical protein
VGVGIPSRCERSHLFKNIGSSQADFLGFEAF